MIGYFFMYVGAISVFTRVLLLGRMVDWLGEAKLSRLGLVLLAGGVVGMPLSRNLGVLAVAGGRIPLGAALPSSRPAAPLFRVVCPPRRSPLTGIVHQHWGAGL